MNDDNFIAHYGIPGMKWGVRRSGGLLARKKAQYARAAERNKPYQDKKQEIKKATKQAIKNGASAYKKGMTNKLDRKMSDTKKQVVLVKKGTQAYKDAMSKKNARKISDTKKQAAAIKKVLDGKYKKKLDISKLSDSDLKQLTSRLQLEKQYKDLTKKDKSIGAKLTKDIVGNAAKETAKTYVAKAMTAGVEELLKNKK